jgi:hypothetical protein
MASMCLITLMLYCQYIDLVYSDILSFFKEEADGESVNRISLLAQCQGSEKTQILKRLVDEAVVANEKILQLLGPNREAYDAYRSFSCGFISFHVTLARYRLDELHLDEYL